MVVCLCPSFPMTAVMKSSECWISWVTPIPSQMPMAPPKSDTIVVNDVAHITPRSLRDLDQPVISEDIGF